MVEAALQHLVRAHYDNYGKRCFEMLEHMEEYAVSDSCRKARMLNYFSAITDFGENGCGRCDICGIEDLEQIAERKIQEKVKAFYRKAGQMLEQGAENVLSAEHLENTLALYKSEDRIALLRDQVNQLLEERPDNIFYLLAGAQARKELGEDKKAFDLFVRALKATVKNYPDDFEKVFQRIPREMALDLIRKIRSTMVESRDFGKNSFLAFNISVTAEVLGEDEGQVELVKALLEKTDGWRSINFREEFTSNG